MSYILTKLTAAKCRTYLIGWVKDWHKKPISCCDFNEDRAVRFPTQEHAKAAKKLVYQGNTWSVKEIP